ncbi:hypothetical protein RHGRI_034057 [Rhododendron griersonianum]|uniref:CCHC-type domain-containing protein n=1 Tax=Rhododendron griersonianum TaxID=479676 RepID=A0AAV6I246_9ERIC|nr:hypothetical protein RHGRI_034057 [Rhododendron griersonianum]
MEKKSSSSCVALWFILVASMVMIRAEVVRVNKSGSGGVIWSSAEEEGDLVRKGDADGSTTLLEEVDGGFSSLDGMLQWAIGHSDPTKLKETAESVQQLSSENQKQSQLEFKEVMESLKIPSDAELMQIAIDDLNNSSLSLEEHHRALQELLILVEPIDNAKEAFHQLVARVDLNESEDQMVARYISGLTITIQDALAMQTLWTVSEAYNRALVAEKQEKRKFSRSGGGQGASSGVGTQNRADKISTPAQNQPQSGASGARSQFQSGGFKCFKCGDPGHKSSDCRKASGGRNKALFIEKVMEQGCEDDIPVYDEEICEEIGDLHKLGGLSVVIRVLDNPDSEIRMTSAWILGKASQNNPVVQKQVLELGGLPKLVVMVKSSYKQEATKALYAVSALIRNNVDGQEMFYAESGDLMLQDILSNSTNDITLRRKCVFLVADLAESQLETRNKVELPFFSNPLFLKSVVDLTASTDLDLQEKALVAIKNLLQLRTTEALVLRNFCDLDGALEKVRQQLQQLMLEDSRRDYAMDVESLRREVELIYLGKLEKLWRHGTLCLDENSHFDIGAG